MPQTAVPNELWVDRYIVHRQEFISDGQKRKGLTCWAFWLDGGLYDSGDCFWLPESAPRETVEKMARFYISKREETMQLSLGR